ncbi:MAG: type transport system permease protein [Streptomyces sp.]|nr:type transport system permease protein [Streptomyces sp.]
MKPLSPWRVELLRINRTRRLLVLAALQIFLGATGPLVARYAQQIFSRVSGSSAVTITVAAPRPADGILGYYKSAMQVGLVACAVVTALAVCMDSRPALSVFYRTRSNTSRLMAPRLALTLLAACGTYTLGFLFAWYETLVLIGAPAVVPTVETWSLGLGYTAFAVVLTFIVSGFSTSSLASVGTTVAVMILLPVLGGVRVLSDWVPSRLTTLPPDIYHGVSHPSPVPPVLVTVAIAVAGGALALRRVSRRRVSR